MGSPEENRVSNREWSAKKKAEKLSKLSVSELLKRGFRDEAKERIAELQAKIGVLHRKNYNAYLDGRSKGFEDGVKNANQLQAKIEQQARHIKLLQGADDTSTKTIADLQTEIEKSKDRFSKIRVKNAELNLILFHKENGLSHPDAKITKGILKSELADLQAENKQLKDALEYAHCQLTNINVGRKASHKFELNLELLEQALKG